MKLIIYAMFTLVMYQFLEIGSLLAASGDPFATIESTVTDATDSIIKIVQALGVLGIIGFSAFSYFTGRLDFFRISMIILAIMIVSLAEPFVSFFQDI